MASTDCIDDNSVDSTDLTPVSQAPMEYEEIFENIYVSRQKRQIKEDDVYECNCDPAKNELCDVGCLNRMYSAECNPDYCLNRERCHNRRFQNREWCEVQIQPAGKKGWGLFARQRIKKDAFVIEYIGEVIDSIEVKARLRWKYYGAKKFFILSLGAGHLIDATLKGSRARFMNHSCSPNCYTQKWTVLGERCIGFFALKDIEIGEELTFDYQFQRYGEGKHPCYCGSAVCRKWLGANKPTQTVYHHQHHHHHHNHNIHRIIYRNIDANIQMNRHSIYYNKLINMQMSAGIKPDAVFQQLVLKGTICKAVINKKHNDGNTFITHSGETMIGFDHICYRMLNVKKEINFDQLKSIALATRKTNCNEPNALLHKLYGDCIYDEEEDEDEDEDEDQDEDIAHLPEDVLLASPSSLTTPITPCSEPSSNASKNIKFSSNSDSNEKEHEHSDPMQRTRKKSRKRRRSEIHHRNEDKHDVNGHNPFKRHKRDNAFASDGENDADIKRNDYRSRNRIPNYNRNRNDASYFGRSINYNYNNHNSYGYNRSGQQMSSGMHAQYNHHYNNNNYHHHRNQNRKRFNNNNMNMNNGHYGRPRHNNYRRNKHNNMVYAHCQFANNQQQYVFHNRMQRNRPYHNQNNGLNGASSFQPRRRTFHNKVDGPNRRFFDRSGPPRNDWNVWRENRSQFNQNQQRKPYRSRKRERGRGRGRGRKRNTYQDTIYHQNSYTHQNHSRYHLYPN